jgi:EH domain-containing protein 1
VTLDHPNTCKSFKVTSKFTCRSFNDKPVNESAVGPLGKELFEREQDDLLSDLKDIPKKACDRRVSFFFHALFQSSVFPY